MPGAVPQEQPLVRLSPIRRVRGRPDDPYEVIFLDQHDRIIVPLTEWYRLRKAMGPESTRNTYLTCLLPYLTFLLEKECPWNASPDRLRSVLIEFHRDRLGCLIRSGKEGECIEITPTRDTPLQASTLGVMRAALRDFYLVLKDADLYAFTNPLSSEVLVALKREQTRALENLGAPDHAGIRAETREQSRRRPTAFIRHPKAHGWEPELRKELADVREGMHRVLDAMIDSNQVPLREKAVLELLQNTGARLHEIVLLTVRGYRNEGSAGQAQVVNKGSYGREIKTIYFAHSPQVEQTLTAYLEQVRPLHDPHGRKRLADADDHEALFLTERGTPYSPKAFYFHWYKHYELLKSKCPVRFSPHDLRHLFITEYLIRLRTACGAGTDHFDAERYLREREAFGSMIMGWRSSKTIDIYDHTRDGEAVLSVLADYQHDLSQRNYGLESTPLPGQPNIQKQRVSPQDETSPVCESGEIVWMHDAETLAWIKKQQVKHQEK